jgi:hypothetical protein
MGNEYRSARCGADAGGLLFCGDCAPVDTVRQGATVKMSGPISAWIEGGVGQQQAPPPSRVEIRTRVRSDPDRKPARTVTAADKWNYDRGRIERCTIYTDRIDNLFVEVWQEIETGDVTHSRTASLDDQSHHGQSHR